MERADIMPVLRIIMEIGLSILRAARSNVCKARGVSDADRIIGATGIHENACKSRGLACICKAVKYPISLPESDQKASLGQDFEVARDGRLRHA
jgi:hypothetical protein